MTPDDRQILRDAATAASAATPPRSSVERAMARWSLQTSNSFRRIGYHGDGDVLCGTKHPLDGHPDLLAPAAVLDYIVAAQPRVVMALLDDIDALEDKLESARVLGDKIADVEQKLVVTAKGFVDLGDAIVQLTHASNEREMRSAANHVAVLIAQLTAGLQEVF